MKIINFQGDLTNVSAKIKTLVTKCFVDVHVFLYHRGIQENDECLVGNKCAGHANSIVSELRSADVSVTSPWTLFNFIVKRMIFRIKVSCECVVWFWQSFTVEQWFCFLTSNQVWLGYFESKSSKSSRIFWNQSPWSYACTFPYTVGPLIIESLWEEKRVSTGALRALDDPVVVQTKIWKGG